MAETKTSVTDGPVPSMDEILARLAARPPRGKKPGATSFAKLEDLAPVPEPLRDLWSWSNGCKELLRRDDPRAGHPFPVWDDLFSVETAAQELALNREEAAMKPKYLPFGGEEGSGDSLVLDTKTGQVLFWDHEMGDVDPDPVAASLPELLARTLDVAPGAPEPAKAVAVEAPTTKAASPAPAEKAARPAAAKKAARPAAAKKAAKPASKKKAAPRR